MQEHSRRAGSAAWYALHALQPVLPTEFLTDVELHRVQTDPSPLYPLSHRQMLAPASDCEFAGQAAHSPGPVPALEDPARQSTQSSEPAEDLCLPAAQAAHPPPDGV